MSYIGIVISFICAFIFFLKEPYKQKIILGIKLKPAIIGLIFLFLGLICTFITTYLNEKNIEYQTSLTAGIDSTTKRILSDFNAGLNNITEQYKIRSDKIIDSLKSKTDSIISKMNPMLEEVVNNQKINARNIDFSFSTQIPLTKSYQPVEYRYSFTDRRIRRFANYSCYKPGIINLFGKDTIIFKLPNDVIESSNYYCELLQYLIFMDLVKMQHGYFDFQPKQVYNPLNIGNTEEVSLKYCSSNSQNRFFNMPSERIFVDNETFKVPKNTLIKFKSSNNHGFKNCEIRLVNPELFDVSIKIRLSANYSELKNDEALFERFHIPRNDSMKCTNIFTYSINLNANYNNRNLGKYQIKEYQNWINFMFDNIFEYYRDE